MSEGDGDTAGPRGAGLTLWVSPTSPGPVPTDDERILVEPACGAPLAVLYSGRLQRLQSEGRLRTPLGSVVLVVCGGSNIHTAQLRALKSQLGMQ